MKLFGSKSAKKRRAAHRRAAEIARNRRIMSRRAFLGGASVAVALPFLPSLLRGTPSAVAQPGTCEAPLRFLTFYVPNGIHMAEFTPQRTGADFDLPAILQPLAPVQEDLLVLTGLNNAPGRPYEIGDHASGTGAFATCTRVNKSTTDIRSGISADQVVAQAIGDCTRLPSLQTGIEGGGNAGNCDNGYSCAYNRNISWADSQTPLPKLTDPQVVFDRLFAGFDPNATAEERMRRQAERQSVLDSVMDDLRRVQQRVGVEDQAKLDEYLTGVRALETRIQMEDTGPICDVPNRPEGEFNVEQRVDLITDLTVLAFQCDLTRVSSFMLANGLSNRSYDFLGIEGGHHSISHHQSNQENFRKLTIIDTWEVAQLAKLLVKLKETEDFDGMPLLHNSVLFFSSEISDGNRHNHDDMPVLVAGQAGGMLRTGRHIRYDGKPALANLFLSLFQAWGIEQDRFGDDGTELLGDLT